MGKYFIVSFLAFLITGFAMKSSASWYKYDVLITTGLEKRITVNGKPVTIKYTADSVKQHKDTLMALRGQVLNAQNDIRIYGKLLPQIHHTIVEKGRAQSEPFQYFRLQNWSIKTPLNIYRDTSEGPDAIRTIGKKPSLGSSDFKIKLNVNPMIYERR